jgi:hypothetical protein
MIIKRVVNPDVSLLFLPWFVEADQTRQEIGAMLYEKMVMEPQDVCCLAILDNTKVLHGVVVARKVEQDILVWQCHVDKFVSSRIVDVCLDMLKLWAKFLKSLRIVIGPNRSFRAFQRRWGFKPCEKEGFLALEIQYE